MELRHLHTFQVVAEEGGFTRAGEHLGYAQSTITAHIQALERELGRPLFDRLGKKVVLTEAGKRLLPYVRDMMQLSRRALEVAGAGDAPTGTLVIGAPESLTAYRLPVILREYRRRYPQVKLVMQPGHCWKMRAKLRKGELDVAFLLEEPRDEEDLVIRSLVDEELVMIAPPHHPLASNEEVLPEALQGETLLKTEAGCTYRELLDYRLKKAGIPSDDQMEFWNVEAIKNCVMAGLGISYLPIMTVVEELKEGKLIALNWKHREDRVVTQLAYHRDKWLTPALERLLDVVEEQAEEWKKAEAKV
ncbi:LysR family transcriptional regulator [Marinithermofilum abyssi]|uniref:LysR family transcriptional regulator n=1 Tax=Marinithermofilum abyssi TaxID=1571185 RepID=A0A8J2VBP9_9BACL|nr:LysR family transcriptional regulator [Marinithermofilum abyssi]GGE09390.1 LysR family transcriptional regulator [Marinithermofilum abyssi]